jgi:rRNA maturation protein Rpf1
MLNVTAADEGAVGYQTVVHANKRNVRPVHFSHRHRNILSMDIHGAVLSRSRPGQRTFSLNPVAPWLGEPLFS